MKKFIDGDKIFKYAGLPMTILLLGVGIVNCICKFGIIGDKEKMIIAGSLIGICAILIVLNIVLCHFSDLIDRILEFFKRQILFILTVAIYIFVCLFSITKDIYLTSENIKLLMTITWTILGIDLALMTLWFSSINKVANFMLKRLKDPNDHFGWDNVSPFICQIAAGVLCMLITICVLSAACMSYFGEINQGELFNQCTLTISLNGSIFMLIYILVFCLLPIVFKTVGVSLYSKLKDADKE